MRSKSPCLLAAVAVLLTCASALAAGPQPSAPAAACPAGLTDARPWLQLSVCPQAFCNDDEDCRSNCPSDPGAFCNLSTWTCTYPSGGGTGGGTCQSGSICSPARFCINNSNCASCTGGCPGYCAADGICRLI